MQPDDGIISQSTKIQFGLGIGALAGLLAEGFNVKDAIRVGVYITGKKEHLDQIEAVFFLCHLMTQISFQVRHQSRSISEQDQNHSKGPRNKRIEMIQRNKEINV